MVIQMKKVAWIWLQFCLSDQCGFMGGFWRDICNLCWEKGWGHHNPQKSSGSRETEVPWRSVTWPTSHREGLKGSLECVLAGQSSFHPVPFKLKKRVIRKHLKSNSSGDKVFTDKGKIRWKNVPTGSVLGPLAMESLLGKNISSLCYRRCQTMRWQGLVGGWQGQAGNWMENKADL